MCAWKQSCVLGRSPTGGRCDSSGIMSEAVGFVRLPADGAGPEPWSGGSVKSVSPLGCTQPVHVGLRPLCLSPCRHRLSSALDGPCLPSAQPPVSTHLERPPLPAWHPTCPPRAPPTPPQRPQGRGAPRGARASWAERLCLHFPTGEVGDSHSTALRKVLGPQRG